MENFRIMSFAVTFQHREHSTDEKLFYGDEKSVRYRLYRSFQQNFNIFSELQLQRSHFDFGKKIEDRQYFHRGGNNLFEDGNLGAGSRLVLMVLKLADLVQPTLTLTHLSTHYDYTRSFYTDSDSKKDESRV